jgi:pyruvate-formate lyase-activating enzyme
MRCPHCKNHVLQKSGTQIRLRTRGPLTFDEDGICRTECYWCHTPVEIPIEIKQDVALPLERFILRKD